MLAPVDKLPLAARKNIRDSWESKVAEYQEFISKAFGQDYTIEVNFPLIYAYAIAQSSDYTKNSPGDCVKEYFESLIYYIPRFTKEGADKYAIDTFNELCTQRKITFLPDEDLDTYSGCKITEDGVFELNFRHNTGKSGLGTNIFNTCENLPLMVDKCLFKKNPTKLPTISRASIDEYWENENKRATEKKLAEEMQDNKLTFHCDYEAIWGKLVAHKKTKAGKSMDLDSHRSSFGSFVNGYFEGIPSNFNYKLEGDEMMIEGFLEACPKKEIWLECLDEDGELSEGAYCDCVFKDGKFILRTKPSKWGTNAYDAAEKVVDLL